MKTGDKELDVALGHDTNIEYSVAHIVKIQEECKSKLDDLNKSVDYDKYMDWVMLLVQYNDFMAEAWREYGMNKISINEMKTRRWNELRPENSSNAAVDRLIEEEFLVHAKEMDKWKLDLDMLDRKYDGYSVKAMKVWADYFFRMQREVATTQ